MTVFIHTGDWQIGKPYGKVSDPVKRVRRHEAIDPTAWLRALEDRFDRGELKSRC